MKTHLIKTSFVVISALSSFTGCDEASETEKQARRENAFDVAGSYSATKAIGSDVEMKIEIRNQSSRSDILIEAERLSPITDQEKATLSQFGISDSEVISKVGGKLRFDSKIGGGSLSDTNVSDDFGATSRIQVSTKKYFLGSGVELTYVLRGVVQRDDLSLRGNLTMELTKTRGDQMEFASASTTLVANTNLIPYDQYFGYWSGRVESSDPALQNLGRLSLQKNDESTFRIIPTISTVTYKGETYSFVSENISILTLKNQKAPFVEMIWQTSQGKRLVLVASIWSLGQFTGNILLVEGSTETVVAGFQLKRG